VEEKDSSTPTKINIGLAMLGRNTAPTRENDTELLQQARRKFLENCKHSNSQMAFTPLAGLYSPSGKSQSVNELRWANFRLDQIVSSLALLANFVWLARR
jgi:hypothetical protein